MTQRRSPLWALGLFAAAALVATCGGATAAAPTDTPAIVQATLPPTTAAASVATTSAPTSTTAAPSAATATAPASTAPASATPGAATSAPAAATPPPATPPPATPPPATPPPATPPPATPPPATSRNVAVTLTDNAINLGQTSAPAGQVTFSITNTGYITHELVVLQTTIAQNALPPDPTNPKIVQQPGLVGSALNIAAGASATLTLNLAAGPYDLICNIANHYRDGMHTAFTVTP